MTVVHGKSASNAKEAYFLVLASANDLSALWVYQQWQRLTSQRILLLAPETICTALNWHQHMASGASSSYIRLADATELEDATILGIYNRFFRVMPLHWQWAPPEERIYVEQEYMAILLSWMHALRCPILNPPTSRGLSGANRSTAEWRMLGIQAGLPIMPLLMEGLEQEEQNAPWPFETAKVVMLSQACHGFLPSHLLTPAQCLCLIAGTPLLELHFACRTPDDWLFLTANPWPDLRETGTSILMDINQYFTRSPDSQEGAP